MHSLIYVKRQTLRFHNFFQRRFFYPFAPTLFDEFLPSDILLYTLIEYDLILRVRRVPTVIKAFVLFAILQSVQ